MAVLGCRSLVLGIITRIRRWRNLGFSQSVKIFENVSAMLRKIKGIYLNTIKRYFGRV